MPFAKINGTTLHYHVKGEGLPIIFIHPPLLTKANFNYQVAQLSGIYRVITFDIRGHGHSVASRDEPLTYPLIVEDMKQLMDHLDIQKAYVCGYSTGGSIALEAILTYPDRFYGGMLISAVSEASDLYIRTRIKLAVSMCQLKAKNSLAYAICRGNADCNATFQQLSKDAKLGKLVNWRQYYEYSLHYNCTYRLGEIRKPMLLVYGKKDRSFYRYADILERKLLDNKLILIRGVSHQIPTKAAQSMNEIIKQWLTVVHREQQVSHIKLDEPMILDSAAMESTIYNKEAISEL
ncbi:MAG: alpha/beta hydrolase [Paenibacillaceae bacterium]